MKSSSFKLRSMKLKALGFKNYGEYLASEHWRVRRSAFEAAHDRQCKYCSEYGHHLHHRTYKNLGAEEDGDLEWVCACHHEEITRYGSIQPSTPRQKAILCEHGYAKSFVDSVTFGSAFDLIGRLARGETRSPLESLT